MKLLITIILTILYNNQVFGQIKWYANYTFNGCTFRVIDIGIDSSNINQFDIINNSSNLIHYNFLQAEAKTNFSSYMWLTGTSYDNNCNAIGYYTIAGNVINLPNKEITGNGNFFMKPNGAILFTKNTALIVETADIESVKDIQHGMQSGPLYVSNGNINTLLMPKSINVELRSGVGLYKNSKTGKTHIIFVVSIHPVNMYVMATLFKNKFGCQNALALTSANCAISPPYEINEFWLNQNKVCCGYIRYKPSK